MPKIKVADLAVELNLPVEELILKLKDSGFSIKSAQSLLSVEEVERIKEMFKPKKEFIVIKKEDVDVAQEQPKKKKLIIKKKVQPTEEVQPKPEEKLITEEAKVEVEKVEVEIEEAKEIKEKEKKETEKLEEPSAKRVVTEFKPRRERYRKREEKPEITPPPQPIPEKPEKEEKKKKEKIKAEEKKPKKKPSALKKEREVKEEIEDFFFEEEPTELFEERPEEKEKPRIPAKKEKPTKEPSRPSTLPPKERKIKVYETIQVGELAKLMGVKVGELLKKALMMGLPLTINQSIDADTAAILADEFGFKVEKAPVEEELLLQYVPPKEEELKPRPPVVTVMGHVDHGKTTLLDAIRKTDVASREAGGITQHIGAYKVTLEDGRQITFIDTPGHEAFTTMRARGAQVTDTVILVVAADDGVMEQTKEAIEHARAAGVPIVVAINKVDKPNANPERVKSQLAELGLVPEEWGGDTLMANISARNRIGIEELLELVLLQAEMLDLKAAYDRPARGRVIESRLDKGKGPVATVLIQEGMLREGDVFVSGQTFGRVRAMLDSLGQRVKEATPSTPVEILGFEDLPQAGDDFIVVEDEEKARKVAEYRQRKAREAEAAKQTKISLEKLFEKLKEGELKDLKIVLKADTQGTLEALDASLQKLSTDKVKVTIIRKGIGAITESDVMLASASDAIVIGFSVKPTSQAKETAKQEGVDIRFYDVIYHLLEDIKKAMEGLLEPVYEEVITGVAEVRATFKVPKVGIVAGCYVKEGVISRNNKVRVIRDGVVVFTGGIASLKRFKEDVKEVQAGYECGLKIENFNDVKVGDIIEAFEVRKVEQKL
jgi:translation initiation factor IF-2